MTDEAAKIAAGLSERATVVIMLLTTEWQTAREMDKKRREQMSDTRPSGLPVVAEYGLVISTRLKFHVPSILFEARKLLSVKEYRLTPLGLAVRAHLERQSDD